MTMTRFEVAEIETEVELMDFHGYYLKKMI